MSPEKQAALEATVGSVASKATYSGAATSIIGWVLSSEFGILVGMVLGIAGFAVNWYYKLRQDRREQAEHERRMAQLKE